MQEAVDPEPAERVLDPSAWTATVHVRGCELHRHIIAPLAKLDELVMMPSTSHHPTQRLTDGIMPSDLRFVSEQVRETIVIFALRSSALRRCLT